MKTVVLAVALAVSLSGCGGALEALGAVAAATQGATSAYNAPQGYYVVRPAPTHISCMSLGEGWVSCNQY